MRRILLAAATALAIGGVATCAVAAEKFRISLETGPNHVRNISMKTFVEKLKAESAGRIEVEFYEGAALYKDRDVPKALAQGNLEMALPGLWQLDKFVPDAVIVDLPLFYGATAEQVQGVPVMRVRLQTIYKAVFAIRCSSAKNLPFGEV